MGLIKRTLMSNGDDYPVTRLGKYVQDSVLTASRSNVKLSFRAHCRRRENREDRRRGFTSRGSFDIRPTRAQVKAFVNHAQVYDHPGPGQTASYPIRDQVNDYSRRDEVDGYQSRGQTGYSQQDSYSPPPYQQYQERRDQRYVNNPESEEPGHWYSASNYSDSDETYQRGDQIGATDRRWPPQEDYSGSLSNERPLTDPNQPNYTTRQRGYITPMDDDSYYERQERGSSSLIEGLVKMASGFLANKRK
jgi:hypothetical protein